MSGLVIAIIGAIVGGLVTWLMGIGDRKQAKQTLAAQEAASKAQMRIAELEAERSQVDAFSRFRPRTRILDADNLVNQIVRLEADEPFQVEYVEYLNAEEAKIASETINRSGTVIDIPINESFLNEIRRVGPWVKEYDLSAQFIFRFCIIKAGLSKLHTHKALIKPDSQNRVRVLG
jgi:hypothetical protein